MAPPAQSDRFCREIHIGTAPGRAVGELVDDFHHFRASIEHDGSSITGIRGEALRIPWQTCGGAIDPLQSLLGMPLARSLRQVAKHTRSHLQCTHLYDAACIAIARAAREAGPICFRIEVPDRVAGETTATVFRNGAPAFHWHLRGYQIEHPQPFVGRSLYGDDLASWLEETFDPEESETLLVLHRACMIAGGRALPLDDYARAIDVPGTRSGVCHTYSDTYGPTSFRVTGSIRDLARSDDLRRTSLDGAMARERKS